MRGDRQTLAQADGVTLFSPLFTRRTPRHALEDAMELRVAAEAGFQRGVEHRAALAGAVDFAEFFHALTIAKIHERDARLLFEQPAQPMRAQAGLSRKLTEA